MLTTWLIELFLNELGSLSDSGDMRSRERLQKEFYNFLSQEHLKVIRGWGKGSGLHYYDLIELQECLDINRKTVYDLISSHGAIEDMVFFATHMEGLYC